VKLRTQLFIIHRKYRFIATVLIKSITSNCSPMQCKDPKVIVIFKPGEDQASPLNYRSKISLNIPDVVCTLFWGGGFACINDTESYSTGSVATGRASLAEQVKECRRQKKREADREVAVTTRLFLDRRRQSR
jgi:hypothetical protein